MYVDVHVLCNLLHESCELNPCMISNSCLFLNLHFDPHRQLTRAYPNDAYASPDP